MKIRPFEDRDYAAYVTIGNRSYPEYGWSEEQARHEDSTWTDPAQFKGRWMLEAREGDVVAALDVQHQRGWFEPTRYRCEIVVDPGHRRRGYGSALLDRAIRVVTDRDGRLLIAGAKESMRESVDFLTKRGFVERQRAWESRLDVDGFDFARFADAEPRVARIGVRLVTLAEEMARDAEGSLRKAFEIREVCRRDIPSVDRPTAGSFDRFRREVEGPQLLRDGFFLATLDGDYVGVSDLYRDSDNPEGLYQGLTGVHPAHRGKGIAMALKLQTVRYARAHGKKLIKTWNDTGNRPMLRINEAMGFVKQPAWIEFEKRL